MYHANNDQAQARGDDSGSAMFAQQLLHKVIVYEEKSKSLEHEKAILERENIKITMSINDHLNILYSIAYEGIC